MRSLLTFLICFACLATDSQTAAQYGGEASPKQRAAVLSMLVECYQNRNAILLGQNVGHANDRPEVGYQRFVESLTEQTGRTPCIASLDYGYNEIPSLLHAANKPLIHHWRNGGLVMISMHPPNPWTGADANAIGHGDYGDLFREGTAVNMVWGAELDRVARGLAELEEQGVVVLFRPFHEMNGGWFWWAEKNQGRWLPKAQFIRLWRDTHHYLMEDRGLTNLLWVYSPTVQYGDSEKPTMHFYPGDNFVDVVALDWYTDRPKWSAIEDSYKQLLQTKKPIGLAEFGPADPQYGEFHNRRMLEFLDECPKSWAFVTYWHSWSTGRVSMVDHEHADELLQDARIIDRETCAKWRDALVNQSKP